MISDRNNKSSKKPRTISTVLHSKSKILTNFIKNYPFFIHFNFCLLFVVVSHRGNLNVRELSDVLNKDIVKPKDFIYTDSITTVCVIVPKSYIE